MMSNQSDDLRRFYVLMSELGERTGGPRLLSYPHLPRQCPWQGLYFFFEPGETLPDGRPRVVRVGTHALTPRSKTTLWGRLRQHRGTVSGKHPGGGNHRSSVFRKHVGSALIRQRGDPALLQSWQGTRPAAAHAEAEHEVESAVSGVIRAMPFLWLSVPTRDDGTSDRGPLERSCIGLLSTVNDDPASSANWLGHHAASPKVRDSSFWNVDHVDENAEPGSMALLASYVRTTP